MFIFLRLPLYNSTLRDKRDRHTVGVGEALRRGENEERDRRGAERAIREVKERSGWRDRAVGGGVMACLQLYMGCVCLEGSAAPSGNVQE